MQTNVSLVNRKVSGRLVGTEDAIEYKYNDDSMINLWIYDVECMDVQVE